jgi:hypothetical protein
MPDIHRYRVALTGWNGAPGVNTLYIRFEAIPFIEDVQGVADLIRTSYESLKDYYAQGVQIQVEPEVQVIDSATGTLVSGEAIVPGAAITAAATASLSRATMMLARLNTDKVIEGRRLRGRIYLGPVANSAMSSDGSISAAARTAISTAFNGLVGAVGEGRLVVWHRPSGEGASDGDYGEVQTVSAKPLPAVLRSRRD